MFVVYSAVIVVGLALMLLAALVHR